MGETARNSGMEEAMKRWVCSTAEMGMTGRRACMRRGWVVIAASLLAVALGCGGDASTESAENTSGDEDPWGDVDLGGDPDDLQVDDEPDEATVAQARTTPTGPGRLRVINRVMSEDVGGTVKVLDESGSVVASGNSGDTFTLPAGNYRLTGEVTDDEVVLGGASKESDETVALPAGGEATGTVNFSVAHVKVRVERGGRVIRTWQMELTRQGSQSPINLRSSDGFLHIRAGRYDGTLRFGTTRIEVTDIIFQGGASGEVPIRVE